MINKKINTNSVKNILHSPFFFLFLISFFISYLSSSQTIIIDDKHSSCIVTGSWTQMSDSSQRHASSYQMIDSSLTETAFISWTPDLPKSGSYIVSIWYISNENSVYDACYTINHSLGSQTFFLDQRTDGGQWITIGTFIFNAGNTGNIVLSNKSYLDSKKVTADAVRFVYSGTSYPRLYQGMWIYSWGTNYGFYSEADTNEMIAVARNNNVNIIFPEVRKTGDAYYVSTIEPRATNIDPTYTNPLSDIITKAHDTSSGKQRIEVHAWVVPYRVWNTTLGSPPTNHVLNKHPEWIMSDYSGNTLDGTSISIDPGIPEVEDYIVDVILELVQNYNVDGIHFDYFRYPEREWGYNPISVERFNRLYDKTGTPDYTDPDWCDFRREQIKALGRKVYAKVKQLKWNIKISAATISWGGYYGDFTQTAPYASVFQDWVGMMDEGILDLHVTMVYKREHIAGQAYDFRSWTQFTGQTKAGRHAIIGLGSYLNYIHNNITQMCYAIDCEGIDGTNIYRYLVTCADGPEDISWKTIKADIYNQRRDIPETNWLKTPTFGILCGTVYDPSGQPCDSATIILSSGASGTQHSDGTGFYAFLKLSPGTNFSATANYGSNQLKKSFSITVGNVTTLNFNFTTSTENWEIFN